jgi:hypothetical protein
LGLIFSWAGKFLLLSHGTSPEHITNLLGPDFFLGLNREYTFWNPLDQEIPNILSVCTENCCVRF